MIAPSTVSPVAAEIAGGGQQQDQERVAELTGEDAERGDSMRRHDVRPERLRRAAASAEVSPRSLVPRSRSTSATGRPQAVLRSIGGRAGAVRTARSLSSRCGGIGRPVLLRVHLVRLAGCRSWGATSAPASLSVEGDIMKFERIIVGVDGSENAARVVDVAGSLARLAGAQVVAVHAIGMLEGSGDATHTPAERHDAVREAMEHKWCKGLIEAGVATSYELRDGNPVVVLLAVADELDVDLIVLGSRGLGGFPELLLGSTSTQVAEFAHCPVVIVPTPPSAA